ncbi:MAG: hypothetical protein PVI01_15380 [Gemmatimonadales bacterium]|jgi:hypothetical protein
MEHRKYTCDRCNGVINGQPATLGGEWTFTIGHGPKLKVKPADPSHLCDGCLRQVVACTRALWEGLWPGRFVK